jgi:hypothetical protein
LIIKQADLVLSQYWTILAAPFILQAEHYLVRSSKLELTLEFLGDSVLVEHIDKSFVGFSLTRQLWNRNLDALEDFLDQQETSE